MILNTENFYNKFSQEYNNYSVERIEYLFSVDKIIKYYASNPSNILDLGCGTGDRILSLSSILGSTNVTLVDQSNHMLDIAINKTGFIGAKVDIGEEIYLPDQYFELITCLWNVLGHMGCEERCIFALNGIKDKLDKNSGTLIIDVNNRYNISQYGFISVFKNIIKDLSNYKFKNGDFLLSVSKGDTKIDTMVHLFTPFEMRRFIKKTGLKIEREIYVNYKNGKLTKSWFLGQIVYVIKI